MLLANSYFSVFLRPLRTCCSACNFTEQFGIDVQKDAEQCFPWPCGMLVYNRGNGHSGYHGYKLCVHFDSVCQN